AKYRSFTNRWRSAAVTSFRAVTLEFASAPSCQPFICARSVLTQSGRYLDAQLLTLPLFVEKSSFVQDQNCCSRSRNVEISLGPANVSFDRIGPRSNTISSSVICSPRCLRISKQPGSEIKTADQNIPSGLLIAVDERF